MKAEWRHVLSIRGSYNFTWDGGSLTDAGGDGVEVSGGYQRNFSAAVTLRNLNVKRAWRNGLSVISVKGLLVEDSSFAETSGIVVVNVVVVCGTGSTRLVHLCSDPPAPVDGVVARGNIDY